ncbi:MAG: hypothetical protein HY738_20915 [Bacteroidia bacterium]|nr:hypothetical protein [Bacteroidia bacterium]
MMKLFIFLPFLLFLISGLNSITAQDNILFLNGRTLTVPCYKIDTEKNVLVFMNKRQKMKALDCEYIFSITDFQGNEKILYKPDSLAIHFLSLKEMKSFISGEQKAFKSYKAPLATGTGFLIGASSPFVLNILYSFLPPAITPSVYELIPVSEKLAIRKCPENRNDKYYILGYREAATSKRVTFVLIGTGVGFAAGIIARIILGTIQRN